MLFRSDDLRISLDDIADEAYLGGARGEMAGATKEILQKRAEQAKDAYIDASIKQAEAYRLSKGLDPLTEGEVAEATRQMQELLDEAIVRGQLSEDQFANVQQFSLKPKYEEITMPAQMRAGKIARPAYTYKKLVGYEGLSDEAQQRQLGLGEEQGLTSQIGRAHV